MASNTLSAAGEYIAIEIAWNGSASLTWIQRKLDRAGYDIPASAITAFGVEAGMLQPVPRIGGFTASRDVSATEFGDAFADWMARA